jgi:hypothetical protein
MCYTLGWSDPMASAKEFVEFWLENSVHPDEQFGPKRGREAVQRLADNLVRAAEEQGFTQAQCPSSNALGQCELYWNGGSGSFGVGV